MRRLFTFPIMIPTVVVVYLVGTLFLATKLGERGWDFFNYCIYWIFGFPILAIILLILAFLNGNKK